MKIAVLGAGNVGCAIAADLSLKGHNVALIKTSHSMHDDNFEHIAKSGKFTLNEFGTEKTAEIHSTSRNLADISGADIIIITTQTTYHEQLIKKISSFLSPEQILLFIPGYLSTAYVLKYCKKNIAVVEAESSFIDGRITKPGVFTVGFRNVRNPVGIFPLARKSEIIEKLNQLDEKLVYLDCVIEAALHNPNMIVHTLGSILSIPRIEIAKEDFCLYHEAYSRNNTHTWQALESLDLEKMNVLESLGFEKLSYVDACKYRNSLNDKEDSKEVFLRYAEMETRAKGPAKINSRYITEDVPQGLVMLESVAYSQKIKCPVTTGLIELSSAALGKDLRLEGRTLQKLGKKNIETIINDYKKNGTSTFSL